jgi:hypothetical protein
MTNSREYWFIMEHAQLENEIARRSARVYLPLSAGTALLFLTLSILGGYEPVAQIGGTVWIALLTLIVSMPLVITHYKKRLRY